MDCTTGYRFVSVQVPYILYMNNIKSTDLLFQYTRRWAILGTLPSRTKTRVQYAQSKLCVQNIGILKCWCLNISERR
jgi:hypothetical protein